MIDIDRASDRLFQLFPQLIYPFNAETRLRALIAALARNRNHERDQAGDDCYSHHDH